MKKLTLEDCQKAAAEHGGRCLSTKYEKIDVKMRWECGEGHQWDTTFHQIRNGKTWCHHCVGGVRYNLDNCKDFAKSKDGKCLSTEYVNSKTKMEWECKEGHQWSDSFNYVQQLWCPECNGVVRYSIEDCQKIAEEYGGKCLSTEYVNNKIKMEWECKEGHQWKTSFGNIKYSKNWCNCCSGVVRYTLNDCCEFAENKGGRCLSDEYTNNQTNMKWECSEGHVWDDPFISVMRRGTWCIKCFNISVEQNKDLIFRECQEIAIKKGGKCLSTEYVNCSENMKWECGEGHVWEATSNSVRGAGSWCFKCLKLTIDECRELAKSKGGKCLSTEYVNARTDMEWECSEGHTWKTNFNSIKSANNWCSICGGNAKHTLEECQRTAEEHGGRCLSIEYESLKSEMKWECSDMHVWEANFAQIRYGSWCPVCDMLVSLKKCQDFAESRGGKCLSTEYKDVDSKMIWLCEHNHQWDASFYSLSKLKTWCSHCSGNAKLTLEDCQRVAEERGGKCLSTKYINCNTPMEWKCIEGHVWETRFSHIKNGSWCSFCPAFKTQKKLHGIIEEIFNCDVRSNYRGFDWLYNPKTKGKQEIDIWVPSLKLAIEYDGEQHFKPVNFGGVSDEQAKQNLRDQKKRDRYKNKLIKNHPEDVIYFIRVRYDEPVELDYIKDRLVKSGVKL